MRIFVFLGLVAQFLPLATAASEPPTGYQAQVSVTAATSVDWTFPLGARSLAQSPADWTPHYEPAQQRYERFVPPDYDRSKAYPLVLFISAGAGPAGWKQWEQVCRREKTVFASPYGAGNECPIQQRVRIVCDVLGDVGRHYHVDPDRTYLGGISGGARIACLVAFALPEYFGGVIPMCAGGELRQERWLWHRVIERLSVAYVTGETDFNRSEVQRYRMPVLEALHVRAKLWVVPGMSHAIADGKTLREVHQWLEDDTDRRRKSADRWPAVRIDIASPLDRRQWSAALLDEAQQRLEEPELVFSGLMQLKGLRGRWPDLPAAKEAEAVLRDYSQRTERPWAKTDLDEKRRYEIAEARSAAEYATGPLLPPYDKMRVKMATAALGRWREIAAHSVDGALRTEAAQRIQELEKLAAEPGRKSK